MSEDTRNIVHGPYETSAQADADAAHVYQSVRGHRYAPAETIQLSGLHSIAAIPVADRINEGLLLAALAAAGVQLGAHDRHMAGWLAAWEPSIVQVVIGWVERAHRDGQDGEIDVMETCGDCFEGRCHWGGERSRAGIAAVAADPESDRPCGCARHEVSYRYRVQQHERAGGNNDADGAVA